MTQKHASIYKKKGSPFFSYIYIITMYIKTFWIEIKSISFAHVLFYKHIIMILFF
jgi:hypothetical protein